MKPLSRQERLAECVRSLTSKPDFPTFSRYVQKVLVATEDQEKSARELTDLIVRDYSLTLKVLRAANARDMSGQRSASVTRAVMLLGTEAVRHLAGSLLIFEHFHNKPAGVRELMMLSMLSANHVQAIARRVPRIQPEEAYLCGLVRNLGELLAAYYLPAEYARILEMAERDRQPLSSACLETLQFSFEDLGQAISGQWGLADKIVKCQRPWSGDLSNTPENLLHAAVSLGHMMTMAVYRMSPEGRPDRLKSCLREFSAVLPLAQAEVEEILNHAIAETKESFASMNMRIDELRLQAQTRSALESLGEGKAVRPGSAPAETLEEQASEACSLLAMLGIGGVAGAAPPAGRSWGAPAGAGPEPMEVDARPSEETLERLTKEATSLLESDMEFELSTFILMILEAAYRGAGFDRVLFGFVDGERTQIQGRMGLGDDVDSLIEQFQFRLTPKSGPVADALLSRRGVTAEAERDPTGMTRTFGCRYLSLYPVIVAPHIVGCLYMENRKSRPELTGRQTHLLNQLPKILATAIERLRRG